MGRSRVVPPLLIVGAGGHARVVERLVAQLAEFRCLGVLDETDKFLGEQIGAVSIIDTIVNLPAYHSQGVRHVALAFGKNNKRRDMFNRVKELGFAVPILVHPVAYTEVGVSLGEGAVICARAVIGAGAQIGANSLINTAAIVDHETRVGAHAHIGPGCNVAGRVQIGEGAFLGLGTSVRDGIDVGAWSTVGAGSVVVKNVPARCTAWGVPAQVKRRALNIPIGR